MKSRCWSISSAATPSGPQRGEARFVGPHEIEITSDSGETRVHSAAHVLIACGTRPFRPDYVPFNGVNVLDSDEIVDLKKLPRSLAVIGAGVIGVEYATIFSALDVAVTLIEPRPTFLDFIDKELIEEFMHDLRDRNVALRLGSAVTSIKLQRGRQADRDARQRPHRPGRDAAVRGRPRRRDRLRSISTPPASRRITAAASRSTPETLQTSAPHIYAAGDVIGFPSLASTSMEQGRVAACHAFGLEPMRAAGVLPLRHLFRARDIDRRHDRGRGGEERHTL